MSTDTISQNNQTGHKKPAHLLINRNFALLWSGQAVSILGDIVFNTTLIVWVAAVLAKGQPWAPLATSGILLAAALPTIALGPVAGVFVDRWDKRRTMLWTDALRMALVLLLLLGTLVLSGSLQLVLMYGVVLLVNACEQFFRPAMTVLIGDIVEQPQQARAMGLGQISVSLATILGPALAPPLLLIFGVQWALLINALSFVVSCATLLAIRAPQAATKASSATLQDFLRDLTEGVRFLLASAVLRPLVLTTSLAMLGGGALSALDIFFVTHNLHTSPALYGLLETAMGAGSIVGAVVAGIFAERIGLGRTTWLSLLALGFFVLVYARLTSFTPAIALLFIVGAPFAALSVAGGPLLLRFTPHELIGRVSSLFNPLYSIASIIGGALAGYLDSTVLASLHIAVLSVIFGPVDTIFMAAGIIIVLSGLYLMLSFRHVVSITSEV